MKYNYVELGKVIKKIIDYRGKTPKKLGGDWVDSGIRVISAKNMHAGKLDNLESIRYVNAQIYSKWMKDEIQKNDILLASEGASMGESLLWNSNEKVVLGQRIFCIRCDEDIINPYYLAMYMQTPEYRAELRNHATGTAVFGLRQTALLKTKVRYVSKEMQNVIGNLYYSINEKININAQINKNLSYLLQTIYQEQFGDISLATNQGSLSDICSYSKEKVAVSELNVNTYFSTENMLPGKAGSTKATSLPATSQTTACRKGDTLISNIRPYFKKIVYCENMCGCSTDVLCFTPVQPQYAAYLFSTLYTDKFFAFMVAGSKGTKMPRGDKQQIMMYTIVLPSENELEEFNAVAFPVLEQLNSNKAENKRLSALRDALLPKLISGEIDISTIDL